MDYLSAIKLFVMAVDHGGFSAAAVANNIRTSSVSRAVSSLEKDLGVALFRRTTRQIELTQAGLSFYHASKQLLADFSEAKRAAKALTSELAGNLRIRAPVDFGRLHVAPLIPEVISQASGLRVELMLTDDSAFVMEGFDIGIWVSSIKDSRFFVRRLTQEKDAVCASPHYAANAGPLVKPVDLRDMNCLIQGSSGVQTWQFTSRRTSVTEEIQVSGNFRSNDVQAVLSAALAGLGVARLPLWLCGEHVRRGSLVPLLQSFETVGSDSWIHAVYSERLVVSPKIERFVRVLEAAQARDDFGQAHSAALP